MKVKSLELKYFKRFRNSSFDFMDPETGLAQDLIVLIGANGAGKTSLLQAIAATLGVATGRLKLLSDLELKWAGFNYELVASNWGKFESDVTVQVEFSLQELKAVQEFQHKLQEMGRELTPPAREYAVNLRWRDGKVQADTAAQLFQFKGREYAKQLRRSEGFQVFERVGSAFWHTEQRTSTSLTTENPDINIEITDDILRDRLSKWRQFHQDVDTERIQLRPGQKDLYADIEKAYKTIFPGRSFEGPVPREGIDDILSEPWFYLYDGKNQYEISEMSAGERATFPILVDFANWNIHNSVILIDEIELHLHPPLQQALLRILPKLGKNNQFIITTHSDYIEQLVPEEYVRHLQ
ncbi:MAG: AAA family ATPase [Symploca sp. SIO1B1]|nr:AAA family ATPase [Symploca sp. SIO2D2]NER95425.1 AAA family ATPase [Symploca sp. SIO1B1]